MRNVLCSGTLTHFQTLHIALQKLFGNFAAITSATSNYSVDSIANANVTSILLIVFDGS